MINDARHAIRGLIRTPGYTAIAMVTLALGIGANSAIFSVVNAVVLRPLPYSRPAELMSLRESLPSKTGTPGDQTMPVAPATLRDWSDATTFAGISAYAETDFILVGAGEPERIPGAQVSWDIFETLAVAPLRGRFFTPDDDQPDRPLVAVIGHDLWTSRFGSDPAVIGRAVELSGKRYVINGVAPEGFSFPATSQIWTPLALPEGEFADNQRLSFYLDVVGRLKAGVTPEHAAAELNTIARRLATRFPKMYDRRGVIVTSLHEATVGDVRRPLFLLLGTVAIVLLIACANVANLQLARASGREGEIAIRSALGASRPRIIRQLLTESLLLAATGAVAGLLLAMWARDAIVAISPASVPRLGDVSIDPAVMGFTALLAVLTGIVFGFAPAVISTGRTFGASLRTGHRGTGGIARRRLRSALVVSELALSLALLVGAGLLARTFYNLTAVDPGFSADRVMTMEVVLPRAKYPEPAQRVAFFDAVLERLATNPTFEAAGATTNLPLSNTNMSFGIYKQDMTPDRDVPIIANLRGVAADYFRAIGVPVLRGRAIGDEDRLGSQPVVVINEMMARRHWPNSNPIGERVAITRGRTTVWREIVGIVGNVRHAGLGSEPEPEVYMPYAHDPFMFLRIAVKSGAPREAVAGAMRAAVWAVDRDQPVSKVRPMEEVIAASVATPRFNTILIGSFAALALVLAAVGLYGVISYSVTQRLHEIGVRIALGATPSHVIALVVRQGAALAAAGLLLGCALAVVVTRLIATQLYGTTPTDPLIFVAVAALLGVIALLASYVPARRALSVDPIAALKAE